MTQPMDPAPPARRYPNGNPVAGPPQVPLGTDFNTHLAEGGYPDIEAAGLAYAAGQRAAARAQENRAQTTGSHPADDSVNPVNPQGPGPTMNAAVNPPTSGDG
jgi:hypothetical protein